MKTAGDVLSSLFGEGFVKKARGYSKLFDSWTDITAKNGIAAAAAHSRIKDLNNGILLVEMDHPGWKQILQTKQSKLLNDFRIRFPEMNIVGISLMLGKPGSKQPEEASEQFVENNETSNTATPSSVPANQKPDAPSCEIPAQSVSEETLAADIESIKDDELREKLIKLGQTIAAREK